MAEAVHYRPRVVDSELAQLVAGPIAVLLEGARGVGKTESATHQAVSRVLLDTDPAARTAGQIDPSLILDGKKPRLIDEWQEVPAVWDHVRRAVDAREGSFILTGSAVPSDDASRHTGAGRFVWLRMRTMSLFELGRSTGEMGLSDLLAGEAPGTNTPDLPIPELAEIICLGGWPALLDSRVPVAQRLLGGYLDSIARTDIQRVDGVSRDPLKVSLVLTSLARNVATEAALATIARDTGGPEGPIDENTVRSYLAALERLMVIEDQPAWGPKLRSRARLRSAAKRHFCDPSLAAAALRAIPSRLVTDLNYMGFLFESLVVKDLRVYAQSIGAQIFHYRDNIGEVDVVVDDGQRWGALEVKLGPGQVEQAASNLKAFVGRIDTRHRGQPAFLGVVTPGRYGYRRDDGILVVPVQALGP